ncbi:LysR family transcriptional regulator [Streptomyces eurocidicus]|uniref:DNA-binding transcriptional LysR family regulator n=1 Tax=Streptomyces eurocidicus TaxID=66423 RepID=A0A2N8NUE7_STREU|nr:LysR family transcriptional regulator [Streptomyces eurocidicus]MBB5120249.1 DNA-binding transcriptional LysR family regulator [Streptomyces eurocidicus]MBF6056068.1 LysR family transcriptional regulator [Streptomyces eurocidicus]PNE32396.1 LysR family transcriptional regulator [Streptomyces eurocidicus]
MDLLSLRCFQVVARHEHISRAAAELHVAQPSVSRTIARLEAELGVPLFDRRGRRIRLNPHGAAFLRRVDRALGELEDGRRELADVAGGGGGTVTAAAETLLTLAGLLVGFRAAHPGVDVRLHQASADAMAHRLRAREVDFCLVSQPLAGPVLTSVELLREDVLLAVPPGHRLAGRERVALAALDGEPFITPTPGHWQRVLADRLFARAGVRPAIVCEGNEPGAILDLVGAGLGVALLPAMARDSGIRATVSWARLDAPDCHRVLWLARHKDAYLSAAARSFGDFAVEHFRHFRGPARPGRGTTAPRPRT